MGGGVCIVTTSEVSVVGRNDGVWFALLDVLSVPLTDAGTASIGQDHSSKVFKRLELTVTLDGGTDLLRSRSNTELRYIRRFPQGERSLRTYQSLRLNTVIHSILSNACCSSHVLVRGVRAGTDQADLKFLGPLVLLYGLLELGDWGS